ncbi:unnamed protein product [Urochloa humidicola]
MGNCIQQSSGSGSSSAGRRRRSSDEDEERAAAPASSVVKVKMVLTKGELGWLVAQLEAGDRRIEDVLHEMEARKRDGPRDAAGDGWRPSLESIVECPAEDVSGGGGSED